MRAPNMNDVEAPNSLSKFTWEYIIFDFLYIFSNKFLFLITKSWTLIRVIYTTKGYVTIVPIKTYKNKNMFALHVCGLASRVYYIYRFDKLLPTLICWEAQRQFLVFDYWLPWIGTHTVQTSNECSSSYGINNIKYFKESLYTWPIDLKFKSTTKSNTGCRQFPLSHCARLKLTGVW